MAVLQLLLFAAGLFAALLALTHPRKTAPYLDRIAGTLGALSPNQNWRSARPFSDGSVRAMALTFALLFTIVLCGLATQLARGL
jgi:hypothetical protein